MAEGPEGPEGPEGRGCVFDMILQSLCFDCFDVWKHTDIMSPHVP